MAIDIGGNRPYVLDGHAGGKVVLLGRSPMAHRVVPGSDGRMPDPRTREGMPDLYAYAHLLAEEKRRRPGDDVMSILLAQADDGSGRVSVAEFENMFWLFAVAGNAPGGDRDQPAVVHTARAAGRPLTAALCRTSRTDAMH